MLPLNAIHNLPYHAFIKVVVEMSKLWALVEMTELEKIGDRY